MPGINGGTGSASAGGSSSKCSGETPKFCDRLYVHEDRRLRDSMLLECIDLQTQVLVIGGHAGVTQKGAKPDSLDPTQALAMGSS